MEELIRLQVLLQCVLHKIEDVGDQAIWKRELKMRSNNYYKFIEKHVEDLTTKMNLNESDQYVEIVSKIESFVNEELQITLNA